MMYHNKKSAFTLSEVLITLGIIGVVAALTIPNVIANYQKHAASTAVKKMYSMLNQALNLSKQEYGMERFPKIVGSQAAKVFMEQYLNKHLSVAGVCNSISECYGDKQISFLKGDAIYYDINYFVVLNNGGYLGCTQSGNAGFQLFYDINGAGKPNVIGKDIFMYYYFPTDVYLSRGELVVSIASSDIAFKVPNEDRIYAGGYFGNLPAEVLPREQLINTSGGHYGCNKLSYASYTGSLCAALIIIDGKVSNDYPW